MELVLVFAATLVISVVSGFAGGGGGLLMVPFFIFLGLPAPVAVGTNKMSGLGATFGALSVFFKSGLIVKRIVKVMLPVAVVIGVITPFVFIQLDTKVMEKIIGGLLIVMTPTLFLKHRLTRLKTRAKEHIGYICYSFVLALQSLFGTGIGTLQLFILTLLFDTTKLQANATKRAVTATLTPVAFIGLAIAGFVRFDIGIAALLGALIGSRLGAGLAIKKGEHWAKWAMAVPAFISGVVLLVN